VNDTYGHHTGDLLLREVAERFRRSLRQSDTVGRLGGDEFALILPATSVEGAIEVADMIRNRLAEPFLVESKTLLVGASIGITVSPDHGANVNNLLRYADSAMYEAKRSGGGWLIYTPDGRDASLQDDLPIARGA
jgi:diguanylate cyclase (GGDEF)-like protein